MCNELSFPTTINTTFIHFNPFFFIVFASLCSIHRKNSLIWIFDRYSNKTEFVQRHGNLSLTSQLNYLLHKSKSISNERNLFPCLFSIFFCLPNATKGDAVDLKKKNENMLNGWMHNKRKWWTAYVRSIYPFKTKISLHFLFKRNLFYYYYFVVYFSFSATMQMVRQRNSLNHPIELVCICLLLTWHL